MTHAERMESLEKLGWVRDKDAGVHRIEGQSCVWIDNDRRSAWLEIEGGKVHLHGGPSMEWVEFMASLTAPLRRARGFDFGEDD